MPKILKYFCLIFLFSLSCCSSKKEERTVFEGIAMTIPYRILIGINLSEAQKEYVQTKITENFNKIDQIYNNWNPESEVSKLNILPSHIQTPMSKEFSFFLKEVKKLVQDTDQRFDPTIFPLYALWKRYLVLGRVPPTEEVEKISECCGWDKIHFKDHFFWKDFDLTACDFCGVAKGYLVDLLCEDLQAIGYESGLVEWGGEIRAFGKHPSNRPWTIGICPVSFHSSLSSFALDNVAIATSGDAWNYWEVEGAKYCHVFDLKKKRPLLITENSIASATVIAKSCMQADAIATALMLFETVEEANAFGNALKMKYPELQFYIQTRN